MTAGPASAGPATRPWSRSWRIARITPLGELLAPPRLTATAFRLTVQTFLVVCLWRGLYASTTSSAGLGREQAVSYAVLAVLAGRLRMIDRNSSRDTVLQHMHLGTIVYWFLRPMPPRRYHALRAAGDQVYGLAWALAGYLICLAAGVLQAPASWAAGLAFLLSMLLGQLVMYRILLLTDLACFWTLRNNAAILVIQFAQNLLSGVYAPLWFFPAWFVTLSNLLPFQATLNAPLSLYIGRLPASDAPRVVLVQVCWVAGLTALTRLLWRRAARRLVSQGG